FLRAAVRSACSRPWNSCSLSMLRSRWIASTSRSSSGPSKAAPPTEKKTAGGHPAVSVTLGREATRKVSGLGKVGQAKSRPRRLKAEGLEAVRMLHREFPQIPIVCDAKTMDAGRAEVEIAAKAGASIATVLGVASDSTIQECVEAGRNYGCRVYVDLLGHPD